jgi:hypothetical protein
LFRKKCFVDQDYFSTQDPSEIIPIKFLPRRNHDIDFRAFKPVVKLRSDKHEHHTIIRLLKFFKDHQIKFFDEFDDSPLVLKMAPLPYFTVNHFPQGKIEYNLKFILYFLWFMFIPRWFNYDENKLSPFSKTVRYFEFDDIKVARYFGYNDIYDNPAIEAYIDFHWQKAKYFFFFHFLRFLTFALCFGLISWTYFNPSTIMNANVLFALIVIFYYLAAYLLFTKLMWQIMHYRNFGDLFNRFDIVSIVFPVIIMSTMLKIFYQSDGFRSIETVNYVLIVGIPLSIFFLWIEAILYLRMELCK